MTDVTVYDGKYRYIFDKDGARAYRYGEKWRDCCGDGFILALAQDLEETRDQRDRLREALATSMRYFDQVIAETGYQSEGERIAHEKARAALAATKEPIQ